jgi:hypothetical protein
MSTAKRHATPAERNSAKTAAYQQRHATKGLCRLCPRRRAKGDKRFCATHRQSERDRDRERKRLIAHAAIAADRASGGTAAPEPKGRLANGAKGPTGQRQKTAANGNGTRARRDRRVITEKRA